MKFIAGFLGLMVIAAAEDRKAAPEFALEDARETIVKLSNFKGKVVLVDFWATECGGCKIEIPWFMELAEEFKSKGLAVVGISMDVGYENLHDTKEGWRVVNRFVRDKGLKYPILMADDPVEKAFGIEALRRF